MIAPAFLLLVVLWTAVLAWPEAALFGRQRGLAQPSFFVALGMLLVATSMLMVGVVASVAHLRSGGSRRVRREGRVTTACWAVSESAAPPARRTAASSR